MTAIPFDDGDLDVAARTIEGEAGGEPLNGKARVALVIRNRASWGLLADGHPEREWWGNGVASACTHPWQFSCWLPGRDHDRIVAIAADDASLHLEREVASSAFLGTFDEALARDATGLLLTHYKVRGTKASWDTSVARLGRVAVSEGHHDFFALGPGA